MLIIFLLTIIGAAASFAVSGKRRSYALGASALFLVLTVAYSILRFHTGYTGGIISTETFNLAPSLGIVFSTGVSGFSDALLILSSIVVFLSLLITENGKYGESLYSYILIAESGLFGILLSRDFLFFYIFWEVVLIPVYFMIAQYGGRDKDRISLKFFVYTHIGSVFLLLSIFTVYTFHYESTGVFTFEIGQLMVNNYFSQIPLFWKGFAIFGFLIAFLVKMPSFPVHSWLPDTYDSAPYPATVILAGGLSIMGGYGLFGILMPIYTSLGTTTMYILMALGIISLVYFSLAAMMQQSLKRMMAFASAGAMGFVTLSFGAGLIETGYQANLELAGGMFQIVAHGLIMAMIFSTLYYIYRSTGHEAIHSLGGIFREAPILSSFFLAGLLASLGLPGLAGFIGEFSILVGVFGAIGWLILVVVFAMIITASYHIWAAQRSLYGPYNENLGAITDAGRNTTIKLLGILVVIFVLGVVPNLIYGILLTYIGGIL